MQCFDIDTTTNATAMSCGGKTLIRWDIAQGTPLAECSVEETVSCIALADNDVVVGTEAGPVSLYNAVTLKRVWSGAGHEDETGGCTSCCVNRRVCVTGGGGGIIMVWGRSNGELIAVVRGHREEVRSLYVAPSDYSGAATVYSMSHEADVKAWDFGTDHNELAMLLRGHTDDANCMALSRDRVATGSLDRTVRLWSAVDGRCLATLTGHGGEVYCVALQCSDTSGVVASGDSLSEIRLWDAASGALIASLPDVHIGCVRDLQLCPTRLISAGDRRRIVVWDLPSNGRNRVILNR